MAFVYLIIWGLMSVVLMSTKDISSAEMYIGSRIMLAAEYVEAALKRRE